MLYTSASAASLIPAFVAVGAALAPGEWITRRRGLGVAASVLGVGLIVAAGRPQPAAPAPLLGDLLILGSVLAWTGYTLVGKGLSCLPDRLISAASVAFGAAFLAPLAGWEVLARGQGPISPGGWLAILYLGAGASAAAFFLWNYALRRLDASETTVYLNLIPAVSVGLAAVMLGESVGPLELGGGLLVAAGVTIAARAPAPRQAPAGVAA